VSEECRECLLKGEPHQEGKWWKSEREVDYFYDSHQKQKMMILIMKTTGSQVDSPVAERNRREGGGER